MVDDFPFQDEDWFMGFEEKTINQYVSELKSTYSEKEIADGFGLSIDDLRKELSKSFNSDRYKDYMLAVELAAQGKGATEIGRILGKPEGTIRYMLKNKIGARASVSRRVANILMDEVNSKTMIDVGEGAELSSKFYGISRTSFDVALSICKDEGYPNYVLTFPQRGAESGKATKMRVLCMPGTTRKEAKKQIAITKSIDDYEVELDVTDAGIPPIVSVDSSRIYILYNENGGILRDGEILLRPGVVDLDLGLARYAQVRIAVDNVAYMKGVILFSNRIPPGFDMVYCTNKHRGAPFFKVFKPFETNKFTGEIDWDNPFGATIKMEEKLRLVPRYWTDPITGEKYVSPINVVNEPGDWARWDKSLSPQYLSKQLLITVITQLNLTLAEKQVKFEQLCTLTNPAVKAKLLHDFAEKCDSDAVELKATPYPTQQYHLLISYPDMPEDQCYAPNFKSGVMVACIRYPHAGPFELALLMVNNNFQEAIDQIGNAPDAIGINPVVAGKLSGADFDGDAVTVFQVGDGVSVKWEPQLAGLKDYEPKELYEGYKGMQRLSKKATQTEMGLITNLIADMQIKGAPPKLVEKAVRHSMTIIDAHKHFLDWKKSYEDNDIKELKIKYQGGVRAGASTLITRAGSKMEIPYREREKHDDKETGKKLWKEKPRKFTSKKTGKEVEIKKKVEKMYYYEDAYALLSGGDKEHSYPVEVVYADFANALKRLANLARKVSMACPKITMSPTAKKTFKPQIDSLMAKLRQAKANSVRERQAMLRTNVKLWEKFKIIDEEIDACESEEERQRLLDLYDDKEKAKITQQYLATNRLRFGACRDPIFITEEEGLAMNAGALSNTTVTEIIRYADPDNVREIFTPRPDDTLSESMIEYIIGLNEEGWPTSEIADMCGLPVSRVHKVFLEGC